jgi:hypothetical protein
MNLIIEACEYMKLLHDNPIKAAEYLNGFTADEQLELLLSAKNILFQLMAVKSKPMTNACYDCVHRQAFPGSCHSFCTNKIALVKGDDHGIANGWFYHPFNFDPVWLIYCDGFEDKKRAY